jgi:hypothetical protein
METSPFTKISWRRMVWVIIFTSILFNYGACWDKVHPVRCNPMAPSTCED